MTDLGKAREEWREWTKEPFDWDKDFPPDWQAAQQHTEETAHTYIAALEAEVKRLRSLQGGPAMTDKPAAWWAISEDAFLDALRRVAAGEDPDLVYAEFYANSDHEHVEDDQ